MYDPDKIEKICSILGVADSQQKKALTSTLDTAAFWYIVNLERQDREKSKQPSKAVEALEGMATALESAIQKIQMDDSVIGERLISDAFQLGRKYGREDGAERLSDFLQEACWALACLQYTKSRFEDKKSHKGGNRKDLAKKRFLADIHENVVIPFHGKQLGYTGENYENLDGALPEFLELCFSCFPHYQHLIKSREAIVREYRRVLDECSLAPNDRSFYRHE